MQSEIREKIIRAIFDPGATEGYKGDRTLTDWQADAVMRVLALSPPVEDGWVLVPRPITHEMAVAGHLAGPVEYVSEFGTDDTKLMIEAAIAASPAPPVPVAQAVTVKALEWLPVEIPTGWYLVPEVPTEEQMAAGLYQSSHDAEYADVCQSYMDMVRTPLDAPELYAAPVPPEQPDSAARIAELEAAKKVITDCLVELDRSQRPSYAWQLRARSLIAKEPTDG